MKLLVALRVFLRFVWILAGLAVLGLVFFRNFPPDGTLEASIVPGESSGFLGGLSPADRLSVIDTGKGLVTEVSAEPVYFHLAKPRFFRQVRVRVLFHHRDQPLLEFGPRMSRDEWAFDLRPLDAPFLEDLTRPTRQGGLGWSVRQDGPYRVYERRASSVRAAELLRGPRDGRIAVYRVEPLLSEGLAAVTPSTDFRKGKIEAVVAKYAPPEEEGGWRAAEATFDLGPLVAEDGKVQMIVSAPGLKDGGSLTIGRIEATYLDGALARTPIGKFLRVMTTR
jgi:hypothetical protein